jgi:hypothetical protein
MANARVFISFSASDKAWASRFENALRLSSLETEMTIPRLSESAELGEALRESIGSSDAVIVLLEEKKASPWQLFEVGAAIAAGRLVIAIAPRGFDRAGLAASFKSIYWVERHNPDTTARAVANNLSMLR